MYMKDDHIHSLMVLKIPGYQSYLPVFFKLARLAIISPKLIGPGPAFTAPAGTLLGDDDSSDSCEDEDVGEVGASDCVFLSAPRCAITAPMSSLGPPIPIMGMPILGLEGEVFDSDDDDDSESSTATVSGRCKKCEHQNTNRDSNDEK
jgi:hypothetical protein